MLARQEPVQPRPFLLEFGLQVLQVASGFQQEVLADGVLWRIGHLPQGHQLSSSSSFLVAFLFDFLGYAVRTKTIPPVHAPTMRTGFSLLTLDWLNVMGRPQYWQASSGFG